MSSDREKEHEAFGPTTKRACQNYINDAAWGDGPGVYL